MEVANGREPHMREEVVFDGIRLSDYCQVASVLVPMPSVITETQSVMGRNGVVVLGSTLSSVAITVYVVLRGTSLSDRKEELRRLLGMLDTTEEHRLYIASDNGRYYMAKLDGEQELAERATSSRVALRFMASEPYLYGDVQQVTIPSGGSATFSVGGTQVVYPRITGTVTRDASTQMWCLRLDDGDVMQVPMGTAQGSVEIDCAEMFVKVNGAPGMISPQSYWFELGAGAHTISNYLGTGSCTVEWVTKWL